MSCGKMGARVIPLPGCPALNPIITAGTFSDLRCLIREMSERLKNDDGHTAVDNGLVRAFQSGDRSAFDRIVLRYQSKVFNLCYWYLGDYQEANDTAQITFMKVYRSLQGFRFESSFSTWLHRIALNNCKNRIKSSEYRERKRAVPIHNPGHHGGNGPLHEMKDDAPSPMAQLEEKEKRRMIRDAMGALPEEHREMVTLRDLQGLSYEEMAQVTGLNLGTVKSRLARARLDLKERLKKVMDNGL
jgi:RNA polymerase sigma-70 factor (ECF subfamily)